MTLRLGNKKVCPTKLVKVEKYFVSNIIKVGSVLDNKGVLSGFSTTDYVKLPFNVPTSSVNSWEVVIPFHYSRAGSENQVLLGYPEAGSNRYKSPQIYLTRGGRIELSLSSDGTSWDILPSTASTNTMELNKDYIVKLSFSGTEYKLEVSRDRYNFTTWVSTQSSTKMYGFYNTSLGAGGGGSAILPTNGSINLKGCSIKVDNETVWQGIINQMPADKYYALAPNYTVIGSPTVYNFVASSFSTDSYVRSTVSTPSSGSFELNTMFTMPSTAITADSPIMSKASGTSGDLFINVNQKICSWNSSTGAQGTTILETGKTYSAKLVSDTVTSVYLKEGEPSSNLNDYTLEYTDYPVYFTGTLIRYGMYGVDQIFPGSIDLKHCDIKVGGVTRWEAVTTKEMYM